MAGGTPFSEKEQGEIRDLCSCTFGKLDINNLPGEEIISIQKEYGKFLDLFQDIISHKGDFVHFPEEGGALDQPFKTMAVLRVMKVCFVSHIQEEQEKAMRRPGNG